MAEKEPEVAKSFDAYEVIGVITPGTIVGLLLALQWPEFRALLGKDGLSIGDFGLFVIVAFVLGHLAHALGNILEWLVWFPGGLPTNRVLRADQRLISDAQLAALHTKVKEMEGAAVNLAKVSRASWRAVTTRAYGRVRFAGKSARIDVANRTYGMFRRLSAALAACLVWYALTAPYARIEIGALVVTLAGSIYRMRRSGTHYARALFLDFIDLKVAT